MRQNKGKRVVDRQVTDELVRKSIAGDRQSITTLCENIFKDVYFSALYLLKDKNDAEDATQETLIKVVSNIGTLRKPEAFNSWLGSITINEVRRHIKLNASYKETLDIEDQAAYLEESDTDYIPHIAVDREEYRAGIMDIIAGLPERQREAVILHYYDDMSVNETAAVMDVTYQAVHTLLAKAKSKIAAGFEQLSAQQGEAGMARAGAAAGIGMAGAAGMMPASQAISQIMAQSAQASSAIAESCRAHVMARCNEQIAISFPTKHAAAAKTGFGNNVLPLIIIVAVIAVSVGMFFMDLTGRASAPPDKSGGKQTVVSTVPDPAWDVVFTGADKELPFVNPTGAEVNLGESQGVVVTGWDITAKGATGQPELVSGSAVGNSVGDVFTGLKPGSYVLTFVLSDQQGTKYLLSRTFIME